MSQTDTASAATVAPALTQSVSLFYRDGGSDKVYNAAIEPRGDLFVVTFSYGRRGSALQAGTKTAAPVPLEKAETIYGKLITEKTSKGYTEQTGGQAFAGGDLAGRVCGNVPQLMTPLGEAEVSALLFSNDWCAQPKLDGRRIMVEKTDDGELLGSNRKGLIVALPQEIADALQFLPSGTVLDGELLGSGYVVFDMTRLGGRCLLDAPYLSRLETLESLGAFPKGVSLAETACNAAGKHALFLRLREERGEGIVLKRLDAPYRPGRPASGGNQRKFKFVESATCQVISVSDAKRSVTVGVLEGEAVRPVGKVTILPNFTIPSVGSFIEVRYLYYYEGGSLYQPIYCGERDDKTAPDTLCSLKRKQETQETEEGEE